MSDHRHLFKSAGTVSIFTLGSRILGFIRDVVIAKAFGTGLAAQAFVVAFRVPNMLRDLVGEGATNAAVIPVLSECLARKDMREFWRLSAILLTWIVLILSALCAAGMLGAPLFVRLIAAGFVAEPEKFALTVSLTRILFPFIFLVGLSAFAMGVLNSLKQFALPAAGPCILNATMIVFGLWICPYFSEPVAGLAVAVLIGGALQVVVQFQAMYRQGFRVQIRGSLRHPAIRSIGKLMMPRIIGSSIYQLNVLLDTMFASFGSIVGEGAVAALYFANRLIQFPSALFGTALATASLPVLSRMAIADDMPRLKETLSLSLRSLIISLLPAAAGLFILARPIVEVLFEHGEFNTYSTRMTTIALQFYCLGMYAYSAARVVTSCFYALKDTLTPLKITFFCLMLNVAINLLLMRVLKVGAMALATSASSTVNFALLLFLLRRKIGPLGLRSLRRPLVRTLWVSAAMGGVCAQTHAACLAQGVRPPLSLTAAMGAGALCLALLGWAAGLFRGLRRHIL
ncbi:MAG: murein biosynthesis integral membrane protein MurJ [Candidatus Omnitrophica bacterium]|nr:murein biosynthesis integral membrane protein MurJ [Candidatus Omnitrophota bacterium]